MPSPCPQPSSSLVGGPLSLTGCQNSERTVSEAVAGEAVTQVEQPAVESVRVEEAMTIVEYPTMIVVGASAALDMALVLASTSSPSPSLAGRFVDDQHLADEVV
jgi:hypothetical protein